MATGAPGTNGVWQYGEDDSEATFSALLNKAASTTDTQLGLDRARLTTLEARKLSGLVPVIPSSVVVTGGSGSFNSTTGLITFTGVTGVNARGVFTSNFTNYKVVFNLRETTNNTTALWTRLSLNGTDTTSAYYYQGPDGYVNSGGNANGSTGAWNFNTFLVGYATPSSGSGDIDFMRPQEAAATGYHSRNQALNTTTGALYTRLVQGANTATTQFDGFTLYPNANGITGTMKVYGWN